MRFQGVLEQDVAPAAKSGVGVEAPNGAQVRPGKTQRDKIIEAVEALRSLLGQGVCSQEVEDLIQEHIPPLPKVTPLSPPLPIPLLNLSVLSNLPSCLKKTPDRTRLAKQGWRCLRQRMICPFSQQEMRGLSFQIDAHHREDDARREKNQSRVDDMEGVFVEEVDSGEDGGVQADGGKRRRVGRFGGGSTSFYCLLRITVMELLRGMSEENQATFMRNIGVARN